LTTNLKHSISPKYTCSKMPFVMEYFRELIDSFKIIVSSIALILTKSLFIMRIMIKNTNI